MESAPAEAEEATNFRFGFAGYGDLQFAWYNYGLDENRSGGALRDSRLTFDLARFVFEFTGELPRYGIEFESEVEFEHGGTGSSLELEYEESGEFENEVEKGGEVIVEELFLQKRFGDHFKMRVGRFYVAMGLLYQYNRPTDYLGVIRSEAETTVIPQVWDEMGIQGQLTLPWGIVTGQIVNGLDSTGFSSSNWVALGHQRRMELVSATDLAAVGRVDVTAVPGLLIGASGYYGGTSRNRPKADLVPTCSTPDASNVAPCGYVSGNLLILDAHAHYQRHGIRGSAMVLWGNLQNADAISARNDRLANALGVLRTPVAEHAMLAWGEVGVDVAPALGLDFDHRLEPFVRVDWYDTMYSPRASLFDNPRFNRIVFTSGVSYTLMDRVFAKADFFHRRLGSSAFNTESGIQVSTGFVY